MVLDKKAENEEHEGDGGTKSTTVQNEHNVFNTEENHATTTDEERRKLANNLYFPSQMYSGTSKGSPEHKEDEENERSWQYEKSEMDAELKAKELKNANNNAEKCAHKEGKNKDCDSNTGARQRGSSLPVCAHARTLNFPPS